MQDAPALEVASVAQEPSTPVVEAKPETEQGQMADQPQEVVVEPEAPKSPEERVKELEEALERTKKGSQKAIDRQTAARKALEEKFNKLQQEISTRNQATEDGAPKESDFDTWEDYRKAEIEHEAKKLADKRINEAKQAELKELETRKVEALKRDLETKEAKFREFAPDYDKAIENLGVVAKDLADAGMDVGSLSNMVLQFDNPPAIFYELAKVDGLIDDIVKLQPFGMMKELIKLEMAIQNKPQPETKEAPKPINTVKSVSKGKDLSSMSGKELMQRFGV